MAAQHEICCYVCLLDEAEPPNLADTTVNGTAVCVDHLSRLAAPTLEGD
jgi:hypothetical protein